MAADGNVDGVIHCLWDLMAADGNVDGVIHCLWDLMAADGNVDGVIHCLWDLMAADGNVDGVIQSLWDLMAAGGNVDGVIHGSRWQCRWCHSLPIAERGCSKSSTRNSTAYLLVTKSDNSSDLLSVHKDEEELETNDHPK